MSEPAEEKAFKALLRRTSREGIQQGLDEYVINRDWKRDMAKEELAHRQSGEGETAGGRGSGRLSAGQRSWLAMIGLIVIVVLAIALAVLKPWQG
ncbi:MAG: hypothetical protein IT565_09520 [Rhodospirillales bacterium]|nr:hypothetical protein [Rhodospirillales bacterium]